MREGAGEEGLPAVALGDVEAHPHGRRVFLGVEPHLENKGVSARRTETVRPEGTWFWRDAAGGGRRSHVIGADQPANRLQGAEGVVLAVALAAAGVPDQVAALLVGQDVGRRPLTEDFSNVEVGREKND